MARTLPAEAQKDGYDGTYKSYTLRDPSPTGHFNPSIGVLVDKQTFYVSPVEVLPSGFKGYDKINNQE